MDRDFYISGVSFKMIDGLITNFHLPESTLLMLVSALAGKRNYEGLRGSGEGEDIVSFRLEMLCLSGK